MLVACEERSRYQAVGKRGPIDSHTTGWFFLLEKHDKSGHTSASHGEWNAKGFYVSNFWVVATNDLTADLAHVHPDITGSE